MSTDTHLDRLVYSIAVHYHNQKTWAFQTRAALELALARGDIVPRYALPAAPNSPSPGSSSSASTASSSAYPHALELAIPTPPPSGAPSPLAPSPSPSAIPSPRASRWNARKQHGLHLKLDGLSNFAHRGAAARDSNAALARRSSCRVPTPSATLLDLYANLLEERMQSCQRLARLIQASNRANLQNRFQD